MTDKKWIDFTIPDIFDDIQRGKRLKKREPKWR